MAKILKWSVPVTEHLNKRLEEYIELDSYKTKSEFIRTSVRDRLEMEFNKHLVSASCNEQK